MAALDKTKRPVVVEGNYTGQLQMLIQAHTGRLLTHSIRKYDGRPFSPEYILNELKAITAAEPVAPLAPPAIVPQPREKKEEKVEVATNG